ncbi:transporter, CPA2 family [Limimonas halophila]|uniref:Transporter, CPA2 family n=1 Tax=Limimonas halophila TaxID=1082479 RepID=A0A1G7QUT7_9PROT|nr:cation:proton antiporter [Limimonas halophila]SDG02288.1 transporter, CPA2 family [Limimonas halophila]
MDDLSLIITTLGALLLLGMLGDLVSARLPIPRVTLLVVAGLVLGPAVTDTLPAQAQDWYPFISNLALLMVGFLLGGKLSRDTLGRVGKPVLVISVFEVVATVVLVAAGLAALGVRPELALVLAAIAPASAPAAVTNVVQELRAGGDMTDTLLGVVAIDDAWGLIVFSALLATAQGLTGDAGGWAALEHGARELGGALVVGIVVGVPAAFLTGRLQPGEPTQAEALGVVLLAGGLAMWLEASFLLAAMLVGATVANLASHHERPFHEIENIEWPFMVLFFVLAGASLHLDALSSVGPIVLAYIALRAVGLFTGAYAGGFAAGTSKSARRWLGAAIMPQAGVALGMALVAGNAFPALRESILSLVVASTVVFELSGPILTRLALVQAGEAGKGTGRVGEA